MSYADQIRKVLGFPDKDVAEYIPVPTGKDLARLPNYKIIGKDIYLRKEVFAEFYAAYQNAFKNINNMSNLPAILRAVEKVRASGVDLPDRIIEAMTFRQLHVVLVEDLPKDGVTITGTASEDDSQIYLARKLEIEGH